MLCPSYPVHEGESVIGRTAGDGRIEMFEYPLPLPESARSLLMEGDAMRSTRFSGVCFEIECTHWDNGCRLGRRLTNMAGTGEPTIESCPIRETCRWHAENGSDACRACSYVTYPGFVGSPMSRQAIRKAKRHVEE